MNKIVFTFDNNALQEIFKKSNEINISNKIPSLKDSNGIEILFSFINMAERTIGLNEQFYKEIQNYCIEASRFASKGMLLSPAIHLKTIQNAPAFINALSFKQIKSEKDSWIDFLNTICKIETFKELEKYSSPFISMINTYKSESERGANKISQKMEEFRAFSSGKRVFYKKDEEYYDFKVNLFLKKLDSLDLVNELNEAFSDDLLKAFPPVEYYVDVHLSLLKQIFNGKLPDKGDVFDMDQILYLDRCDYFISNDSNLKDSINTCENKDLQGRCLNVDEFIEMIFSENLIKRAPFVISNRV